MAGYEEGEPTYKDVFNDSLAKFEKYLTEVFGVGGSMEYAAETGYQYGPESRGSGDAMRHLLLAADLQQKNPWAAAALLYGHEYGTNLFQGQLSEEREQDLKNNALGRYIGARTRNRAEAEEWARSMLDMGYASVLPPRERRY